MNKFTSLFNLLRKGSMVADPAKWKRRHMTGAAVAGFILAAVHVAKAFGYDIPINEEAATALAAAVLVIADLVLVPATTEKVGLPPVGDVPPVDPAVDFDGPDHSA